MLLSFVMLPMHTVAILLKMLGTNWKTRSQQFYELYYATIDYFKELKLYWWPPPDKIAREKLTQKKLLLTALAIAAMKASMAAPEITFESQKHVRKYVKKCSQNGLLQTSKLSPLGAFHV